MEDFGDDDDDQKMRQNVAPEYKLLITIKAGKPKGRLSESLKVELDKVRRLSLSEQELAKVAASHGADIIRYFWSPKFYFYSSLNFCVIHV